MQPLISTETSAEAGRMRKENGRLDKVKSKSWEA
jgi:hypothetical protein